MVAKREKGGFQVTGSEYLERLFSLMRAWWDGRTLAEVGREYGISRQRVGAILADVACTWEVMRKARRDLGNSGRRGHRLKAEEAKRALLHPFAGKLTARQRCALAWQAQGLALIDVAHRMATTVQGVSSMAIRAKWKLRKLEFKTRRRREGNAILALDGRELEKLLAPSGALTMDEGEVQQ